MKSSGEAYLKKEVLQKRGTLEEKSVPYSNMEALVRIVDPRRRGRDVYTIVWRR